MLKEVIELLSPQKDKVYFDGTLGLAGHAEAMLKANEEVKVIGLDRDEKALKLVKKRLKKYIDKRLFLFHGNFRNFHELREQFPETKYSGALLDLGFSSFQIDDPKRGFSFQKEGPLDMRMDVSQKLKASDVISEFSEEELADIFFQFGEEKFSRPIAKAIVKRRKTKPFKTTLDLANLIASMAPLWMKRKIHPATKVFQALRIVVNDELSGLAEAFEDILMSLEEGGRLAVMSFHSLEDRIVKQTFVRFENPCVCPSDFPECRCGKKQVGRRVTKKPIVPSYNEVLMNPRSRSAKLRCIERVMV